MKKALFLLLTLIAVPVFAAKSIVVLPFSDESTSQTVYWLGEGFAESLTEEMFLKDAYFLQRPERKAAYDTLRLPYVGHVSRATMLKLGDILGADYIIFGTYVLEQKHLKVEARVIHTGSSRLSAPIATTGLLENLFHLQGILKKGLLDYFAQQKLEQAPVNGDSNSVPLYAYELYIKGLLEAADAEKINFFERAIESHPNYPQALYRLGQAYFRTAKFNQSVETLNRISAQGLVRQRTEFLLALNSYFQNDPKTAAMKWYRLSEASPVAEIYNNIGISLVGTNEMDNAILYLTKAVELDRDNSDFRFNLAVASYLKGGIPETSRFFREAIELHPNDYQALYWLSKSLERDGFASEAKQVFALFQERIPGDQKEKFPEQYPEIKPLLRPSLSYFSEAEKNYLIRSRTAGIKQHADYLKTYQASARKLLNEKQPDRVIFEVKKGLTFAPFDWYLHHLWGVAYLEQKNQKAAIDQLRFALWCAENIDSHILLAEIYSLSGQYAESKKHIQQILTLDPKHKRAIEIWGKIHNKT